jgi:hypothetical protein
MVFLNDAGEVPFVDLLLPLAEDARRFTRARTVEVNIPADVWRLSVRGGAPIAFRKFTVTVTFPAPLTRQVKINNDRIAELILQGVGERDTIVFADQLKGMTIAENGEVAATRKDQ